MSERRPHIFLHVGTHKTGTTSIQAFLESQVAFLRDHGVSFCENLRGRPNFKDLFQLCVDRSRRRGFRRGRTWPPRSLRRVLTRRHIASRLHDIEAGTCVISSEHLSYLRTPGEIATLRALFPEGCRFTVVLCLRERAAFLASYRRQLEAQGVPIDPRPGRFNSAGDDSWLLDYGAIEATFRHLTEDVRVIDFDAAVANDGNIIHAFCRAIGIEASLDDEVLPTLNVRSRPSS